MVKNSTARSFAPGISLPGCALLTALAPGLAQAYGFTRIDVPNAQCTSPASINDAGDIAGVYQDASGTHPFTLIGGVYKTYPQLSLAHIGGINTAGKVIGRDANGRFTITAGTVARLPDVKGAAWIGGINAAGQSVGAVVFPPDPEMGFIEQSPGGTVSTFKANSNFTLATDINDKGLVTGNASGTSGFLWDGKVFSFFTQGTGLSANGLSNTGVVAGEFTAAQGGPGHGFLRTSDGVFQLMDVPPSLSLAPIRRQGVVDVNTSDWALGFYMVDGPNGTQCSHGYLARPTDLSAAYRGCYVDSDARALPVQFTAAGKTVDECLANALSRGFAFAGLQNGNSCFAGDSLGLSKSKVATQCDMPCTGNPSQRCGGAWRNAIYSTGLNAPPKPAATALGCFVDTPERTLPVVIMSASIATPETCLTAARARGLTYAGVQFGGQCYAGNTLPSVKDATDANCRMPCVADSTKYCGGTWRNSVYATGVTPAAKVSAAAFAGCYADGAERSLPVSLMPSGATVDSCVAAARARGFAYAGLQSGGQCYAGEGLPATVRKDAECTLKCTADSTQLCGGNWYNSVYKIQ